MSSDSVGGSINQGEMMPMFQTSNPDAVDFGQLDLDELFVDCYYDVPGMSSSSAFNNNQRDDATPPPTVSADPTTTTTSDANVGKGSSTTSGGPSRKRKSAAGAAMDGDGGGGGGFGHSDVDDDPDDIMNKPISELTDKQKLERRERNREHAKRSRLRKKFLLESLQEQIHGLQEQLEKFKDTLRAELNPQKADQLIHQICGNEQKYTPLPMPSGFGPVKTLMEPDFRLMSALSGSQQNFAISDPTLPDNPIVYVSQGFLDLTGYTLDQVLGRNCRFLQGPGTDQSAVDVIRKGITEGIDTSVCLLNYKADGTPFWNQFFVASLRDAENNVVNYVGVQCEVSKAVVERHMGDKATKSGGTASAAT